MTIDELKKRPEYFNLTPQQKEFVVAYCTNGGDKVAASEAAYAVNTELSARTNADRCLRHRFIRTLINDYFGLVDDTGDKNQALAIVWKQINSAMDPKVLIDYLKLYGEWKGFKDDKPKPDTPEPEKKDEWALVREMEGKL